MKLTIEFGSILDDDRLKSALQAVKRGMKDYGTFDYRYRYTKRYQGKTIVRV